MAVQFSPSVAKLMAGRGILAAFGESSPFPSSITVYGGAQPTAAQVAANWTSYNSSFLIHFPGAAWSNPNWDLLVQLTPPPAATTTNSGTATWAIVWTTSRTLAQVQAATLPQAAFAVVPVTLDTGDGVIRFTNLTFTSGASRTITDGSFGVNPI